MDHDPDLRAPTGGRAGAGGSFYHLSFRSGSRAGGASARAAFDYLSRRDEYADRDLDEALQTESGHMPSWAEDDPEQFWDTADLYERANGRLYVSADFALPRDLSFNEQVELARDFARELTDEEKLPYTLAIHAGRNESGLAHNPHAHLMFSERRNDGSERTREQWFGRANSKHPERGGAAKSRTFHGPGWVERARERWAMLTNEALERAGRSGRVDHRSYERQGLDRPAGEHFGPAAAHLVERNRDHDRLDHVVSKSDDERMVRSLDGEIAQLEATKQILLRDGLPDEERAAERRNYSHSSFAVRSDDHSWGR
jgi:hypothetical protein